MSAAVTQPAEPIAVTRTDNGDVIGWLCQSCGTVWLSGLDAQQTAARCCDPRCACGAPAIYSGVPECSPCRRKRREADEAARFARAKKVPLAEYTGEMVYVEDRNGEPFFRSTDEIREDGIDRAYVWATDCVVASLDLEDAIDSYLADEHHEDARDWVYWPKVEQAQKLVDEALSGVKSYFQDETTAIVLPTEEEP